LLDSAEKLMLDEGYAAVTYRRVAADAGVSAGLVQYYFPILDELFVALLRRHSDSNLERLLAELQGRSDEPLRVLWEYNSDETTAALVVEFMALANHRKAIRAGIAEVIGRSRQVQLDALFKVWAKYNLSDTELSPAAIMFVLAGVPKILLMEGALEVSAGHAEIVTFIGRRLDRVEGRGEQRLAQPSGEVAPPWSTS
jgi:AcrR family transcriptional regulator